MEVVKDNIAIFEQAETQRLANTAQDLVNRESITPTENPNALIG